jgi:hypothetical protein
MSRRHLTILHLAARSSRRAFAPAVPAFPAVLAARMAVAPRRGLVFNFSGRLGSCSSYASRCEWSVCSLT